MFNSDETDKMTEQLIQIFYGEGKMETFLPKEKMTDDEKSNVIATMFSAAVQVGYKFGWSQEDIKGLLDVSLEEQSNHFLVDLMIKKPK